MNLKIQMDPHTALQILQIKNNKTCGILGYQYTWNRSFFLSSWNTENKNEEKVNVVHFTFVLGFC